MIGAGQVGPRRALGDRQARAWPTIKAKLDARASTVRPLTRAELVRLLADAVLAGDEHLEVEVPRAKAPSRAESYTIKLLGMTGPRSDPDLRPIRTGRGSHRGRWRVADLRAWLDSPAARLPAVTRLAGW